ncbi:hypothetical protein CBP36_21305 (plasmid) [Acidovorax carolinensis]|uniref:Conjugal transfer protein TrbC n=1 Tax=Acidovorax carolinensis TaxID=553814 RepID=A0A240UJ30_9BURK|nr:TrbC/VirB2 family protein [Acidovorax carolinensis]ART61507.1 hypothetical protein CBP36_21305 [Acidovorax carolinensis]
MSAYRINHSVNNASKFTKYAPMVMVGFLMLMIGDSAFAQADELGNGICKVVNLLTGKFLFGVSVLAMVAGGAALLFGAELTDGVKKMVTIVAIVGMILSFGGILSMAFNSLSSAGC